MPATASLTQLASLSSIEAVVVCEKISEIGRSIGATTGTVNAADLARIEVEFPVRGLGDPSYVMQSACRTFAEQGFEPLTFDVNDERARFTVRDRWSTNS